MHKYPPIDKFGSGSSLESAIRVLDPEAACNYKFYIQEKLDGSNFGVTIVNGELVYTCKNSVADPSVVEFKNTCERIALMRDKLNPNLSYHGEAMHKRRPHLVSYARIPRHYFVCFDIYDKGADRYFSPDELRAECDRVGFECIKFIYENNDPNVDMNKLICEYIEDIYMGKLESMLGGEPEGIVIKHHNFWLKGRYVSVRRKAVTKKFKECQKKRVPRADVNTTDDFLRQLGYAFALPARFAKSVQHLSQRGLLDGTIADKRRLTRELDRDFDKEYQEEIMAYLWQELGPVVREHARAGLDEWYLRSRYIRTQEAFLQKYNLVEPIFTRYVGKSVQITTRDGIITGNITLIGSIVGGIWVHANHIENPPTDILPAEKFAPYKCTDTEMYLAAAMDICGFEYIMEVDPLGGIKYVIGLKNVYHVPELAFDCVSPSVCAVAEN